MKNFKLNRTDYKNRIFRDFYPARDPARGPGWYIFGSNYQASARVICNCGGPDVKPRKHPHYNIKVVRGFHTLRECQSVCDAINSEDLDAEQNGNFYRGAICPA